MTDERHAEPNQTAPGAKRASELSRRRLLQASAAVGAATAAGAGGFLLGNRAVETGAAAPALAPSRQGANVLVAGWEEDAATLDPAKTICGHEVRIVNQFGNTLWGLEGTATEPVPMLAESWEGSEDGLTWTVTTQARSDVPGRHPDVTPTAVKWSFDRFLVADHPFYDPPYNLLGYYLGGPRTRLRASPLSKSSIPPRSSSPSRRRPELRDVHDGRLRRRHLPDRDGGSRQLVGVRRETGQHRSLHGLRVGEGRSHRDRSLRQVLRRAGRRSIS